MEGSGVEGSGVEWNRVEWNGVEWIRLRAVAILPLEVVEPRNAGGVVRDFFSTARRIQEENRECS